MPNADRSLWSLEREGG